MQIVRNDPPAITRMFGTGLEESEIVLTHVKRQTTYNIVCIAMKEDDKTPLMIYKDTETGNRWARPVTDFFEKDESGKPKWIWNTKANKIMEMIASAANSYRLGHEDRMRRK